MQLQRNNNSEFKIETNEYVAVEFTCIVALAGVTKHMDQLLQLMPPSVFAVAMAIGLFAGVIKGMVGFAMPTILISGLTTVLSPELALAGLILPTLATNAMQAFRQGVAEAWHTLRRYRVFLIAGALLLIASAQLVAVLSTKVMFTFIGIAVAGFAVMQLSGWQPRVPVRSAKVEVAVGAFAGITGGMSGIWGPPTVAYLTAVNTPKAEQIRAQGVIFGLGAFLLFFAHLQSGVMNAATLPFSAFMVVPAVIGTWIGFQFQDRIAQASFKRLTLIVLLIGGLNLIRRGLLG